MLLLSTNNSTLMLLDILNMKEVLSNTEIVEIGIGYVNTFITTKEISIIPLFLYAMIFVIILFIIGGLITAIVYPFISKKPDDVKSFVAALIFSILMFPVAKLFLVSMLATNYFPTYIIRVQSDTDSSLYLSSEYFSLDGCSSEDFEEVEYIINEGETSNEIRIETIFDKAAVIVPEFLEIYAKED